VYGLRLQRVRRMRQINLQGMRCINLQSATIAADVHRAAPSFWRWTEQSATTGLPLSCPELN
jgi:hypothetical protein